MKNANEYRRLVDAIDPEVRSEVIQHGRCRSTLRGSESERLSLRAFIAQLRGRPETLRDGRCEIR